MTAEKKSTMRLGRTEAGYIVYVVGRGTMRESRLLHAFALGIVDADDCTLAIELTQCTYLDSTFLGCLVNLNKRFGKKTTKRFQIIADQERSRSLLATAHLHTILPISVHPPALVSECRNLAADELDSRQLGHHIMECHRWLAELGGPNQEVFHRIADQLELELSQEKEKKG